MGWWHDTLHAAGIVVLPGPAPGFLPADDADWLSLIHARVTGGGDRRRWGITCRDTRAAIAKRMVRRMRCHGVLGSRVCRGLYALTGHDATDPKAAVQMPHMDYPRDVLGALVDSPERVPLSCQWAVQRAFWLHTYGWHTPGEGVPGVPVLVPKGHMAVWRGDLYHGGGPHVSSLPRVHSYVAEPRLHIPDALGA